MDFDIQFNVPAGWHKEIDIFEDETGAEVTHVEIHKYNAAKKRDDVLGDIYIGEMPEDTDAEDQAFSNYADIVGFEDDDPEDFAPIEKIQFNGKTAYSFEALCEDDSPMKFISQEIKKGVLAIMCVAGANENILDEAFTIIERNMRVKVI